MIILSLALPLTLTRARSLTRTRIRARTLILPLTPTKEAMIAPKFSKYDATGSLTLSLTPTLTLTLAPGLTLTLTPSLSLTPTLTLTRYDEAGVMADDFIKKRAPSSEAMERIGAAKKRPPSKVRARVRLRVRG